MIGRNGPPPLGVGRARATHPSAKIAGPSTPEDTGNDDNLRETMMDSAFWDLDPRAEEVRLDSLVEYMSIAHATFNASLAVPKCYHGF